MYSILPVVRFYILYSNIMHVTLLILKFYILYSPIYIYVFHFSDSIEFYISTLEFLISFYHSRILKPVFPLYKSIFYVPSLEFHILFSQSTSINSALSSCRVLYSNLPLKCFIFIFFYSITHFLTIIF